MRSPLAYEGGVMAAWEQFSHMYVIQLVFLTTVVDPNIGNIFACFVQVFARRKYGLNISGTVCNVTYRTDRN